jgi:anaerobic magnesium-protoporphyrin IX monomethyl ester cyclase
MARVVFCQRLAEEWLGIMYISSMLKTHGHECHVLVEPLEKRSLAEKAVSLNPDIVAFSCLTWDFHWSLETARSIKEKASPLIVLGGTHITLNPEEAISHSQVDIICRGEGEHPMLELADAIDSRMDYHGVQNLWVRYDGKVIRNEIRNLIEDLNDLPFPDRNLYTKYPFFQKRGKRPLNMGRGCPFSCSYCHNASKRELYKGKGRYVRWRSIENILEEIEDIRSNNYIRVLHFIDDSFGINREWFKNLAHRISGVPGKKLALQGSMRADMVTEDLCQVLKEYGARYLRLRFAVECGDANFRERILKKQISNDTLMLAASLFKRYGISFITYSIVGFPGERLEQALETLRINIELRPKLAICFMLQPFPGTELADYGVRKGYLSPQILKKLGSAEFGACFHSRSPLKQKDIKKIENLHKVFSIIAKHPSLFPLTKYLVSIEALSPFYSFCYKVYLRKILFMRRLKDKY